MQEKNNVSTFSDFGINFQESLAHLILKDKAFCDQIGEVIKTNFFEQQYLQVFVDKIYKFKQKHKEHPTYETVKTILKTELSNENDIVQKQVKEFFVKIAQNKEIENKKYVEDRALDFCKKQVVKEAMIKSIDHLEKSSFDDIAKLMTDALNKGSSNDLGHKFIEDFEERYIKKMRGATTTGIADLDAITSGGMGKGELSTVVASTGCGKSFFLVYIGAQAIKAGKNVVYYTLELSDRHVGNRFDACLTGCSLNDLHICKDKIEEEINKIPGKLIIKEYPARMASVQTIYAHLDRLKQRGFVPDVVIFDYPDLMKSENVYRDNRVAELEILYEELRSLAQQRECSVWAASQGNRMSIDTDVLELNKIASSFNKIFSSDLVLTLSRSKEDKVANLARLFVAKNRNGVDGIVFDLFFDPEHVAIKVLKDGEKPDRKEGEKSSMLSTYKKMKANNA